MMASAQTGALAILLCIVFVGFAWLFTVVWMEIDKLLSLVSSKRKTRKFFKKIEGYRRDFE